MNKHLIKAFLCILASSILWSYFVRARLPNLLDYILFVGTPAALVCVAYNYFSRQLYFRHLSAPLQKRHRLLWLSILNKWTCLLLIYTALHVSTIRLEFSEAAYNRLNTINLSLTLIMALCALCPRRRISPYFNTFVCLLSCLLGYQLYLTIKEPAADEAVTLKSPFPGPFCVMSGGYSQLNSVLQAPSRSSRAFGIHISPTTHSHRPESYADSEYPAPFGAPIIAPASGTVLAVSESIPDTPMSRLSPDTGPGNYVILQTEPECYLVFTNLQQHSVQPEVGDSIEVGAPLAAIGKSGMFTEPVLLMIAYNSPDIFDPTSYSIPILFDNVRKVDATEANPPFFPTRNDHYTPISPTP